MLIKICGITDPETAKYLLSLQADLIGLIFVKSSPRCISIEKAVTIKKAVHGSKKIVAVFQDQPLAEVNQILDKLKPDYVQLHGQEDPSFCKAISTPIIKAIRLQENSQRTKQLLDEYKNVCDYFLIDRKVQGDGPLIDLTQFFELSAYYPLFLSGGLSPDNISHVLNLVDDSLAGIDVSSGVEDPSGHKNNKKISIFVEKVRSHYA